MITKFMLQQKIRLIRKKLSDMSKKCLQLKCAQENILFNVKEDISATCILPSLHHITNCPFLFI